MRFLNEDKLPRPVLIKLSTIWEELPEDREHDLIYRLMVSRLKYQQQRHQIKDFWRTWHEVQAFARKEGYTMPDRRIKKIDVYKMEASERIIIDPELYSQNEELFLNDIPKGIRNRLSFDQGRKSVAELLTIT